MTVRVCAHDLTARAHNAHCARQPPLYDTHEPAQPPRTPRAHVQPRREPLSPNSTLAAPQVAAPVCVEYGSTSDGGGDSTSDGGGGGGGGGDMGRKRGEGPYPQGMSYISTSDVVEQ